METGALLRDGVWEASGSGAPEGPKGTGVPEEGGGTVGSGELGESCLQLNVV